MSLARSASGHSSMPGSFGSSRVARGGTGCRASYGGWWGLVEVRLAARHLPRGDLRAGAVGAPACFTLPGCAGEPLVTVVTVALAVTAAQSAANVEVETGAGSTAPGAASPVLYRCASSARSRKSTLPSPLKSPSAHVLP